MIGKMITIKELEFISATFTSVVDVLGEIDENLDAPEEVLEDIEIAREIVDAILMSSHDNVEEEDLPEE